MDSQIWVVVLTGLSGLLGVLLTQSYSRNSALRAELKSDKQKLYSHFIKFLYEVYSGNAKSNEKEIADNLKEYFPKLLSFASNDVIKNTEDLMQHIYKYDPTIGEENNTWNIESMEYFGDLILAIRDDLGHKKFTQIMKWHDVARLWITDIDNYVPQTDRTPRATHVGPRPRLRNRNTRSKNNRSR